MSRVAAQKTWQQIWIRPEVFPIVAAIGSAGTLCVFFCGRQISSSPGFRTFKDARKNECIPEDAKRVKEGISWRENLVRRTVRGMNPQIFPGLNDWMSK